MRGARRLRAGVRAWATTTQLAMMIGDASVAAGCRHLRGFLLAGRAAARLAALVDTTRRYVAARLRTWQGAHGRFCTDKSRTPHKRSDAQGACIA
jgi:hypothetical protein